MYLGKAKSGQIVALPLLEVKYPETHWDAQKKGQHVVNLAQTLIGGLHVVSDNAGNTFRGNYINLVRLEEQIGTPGIYALVINIPILPPGILIGRVSFHLLFADGSGGRLNLSYNEASFDIDNTVTVVQTCDAADFAVAVNEILRDDFNSLRKHRE